MILEAIQRAPELTRRMLRGVIADAAFRTFVIPRLAGSGWLDVTPEGNFSFDYMLRDALGNVSVQVKLQRSEKGQPVRRSGDRYGMVGEVFIVETQRTRTGNDSTGGLTRPYRYGDFDVLAVSMQPSSGRWDKYMFTVARWLLAGNGGTIATIQPVAQGPDDFWTDDFDVAANWLRTADAGKQMALRTRGVGR